MFLWTGLLLAVGAGTLWCTGFPQRWAIRQALNAAIKGRVEAQIDSTYDVVRLSRVRAYKPGAKEPWLDAGGVALDYSVWPGDGNVIRLLSVERLALRTVMGEEDKSSKRPEPAATPAPAKRKRSSAPRRQKKRINLTPLRVTVGDLEFQAARGADSFDIHGLSLDVSAPGDGSQIISLKGDSISGKVAEADSPARAFSGKVDVVVSRNRSGTTISPLQARLGDVLDLEGRMALTREEGATLLSAALPTARCTWDGLLRMALPDAPLSFGVLDASGSVLQLKFDLGKTVLAARGTEMVCAAAPLSLGNPETGISWKNARLRLNGGEASDLDVSGSLALEEREKVSVTVTGSLLAFTASVKGQEIARDEMLALCPPDWRTVLAPINIQSLKSSEASLSFQYPRFKGTATLVPALAEGGPAARVECESEGSLVGALLGEAVQIRTLAALGEQSVRTAGTWARNRPCKFTVEAAGVDPKTWLQALAPSLETGMEAGSLSGTADVEADLETRAVTATFHLDETSIGVTALRLEGMKAEGSVQGAIKALTCEGHFEAQGLFLPGLGAKGVVGKASMGEGRLRLRELKSGADAHGFAGDIDVDLSAFPAATSLVARLDSAPFTGVLPGVFPEEESTPSIAGPLCQGELRASAQGTNLTQALLHVQSLEPVRIDSERLRQYGAQSGNTPAASSASAPAPPAEASMGVLTVDAAQEADYLAGKATLACGAGPLEWPVRIKARP
jgi:hypothetical protein